ncbi:MAG: hypothetical protein FJX59_13595 [Alphaproteobacteria bacterium]|nr:hypothetical protein [Alphaproteobacteria bacterium]
MNPRWPAVLFTLLAANGTNAYTIEPLLGRDGFAGEPTCRECHVHDPAKAERGRLSIEGLPNRFVPCRAYSLIVRIGFDGITRAGFQLSARFDNGAPAGTLAPMDSRVAVLVDAASGVPYAFHAAPGLETINIGVNEWRVIWTAPPGGRSVIVSVAANASNADDSALGDVVLLYRTITESAETR